MDSTYAHSTTTITATRLGANLRNMFINVINHRETNFIITSFIIFAALYASLTAIFERSLLHPLTITQQKQQIVYPPQLSLTPQVSNHTLEEETHFEDFPFSSPFRQCRRPNSYFLFLFFLLLFRYTYAHKFFSARIQLIVIMPRIIESH
uniref:Uncharacterized protein n=1 Tax=Meloidogyne enterolobii TaxID=390850 RepID=A0A6V7V541_MELEN|nr:unnamed protein product [Meloidogyne enterolobii]